MSGPTGRKNLLTQAQAMDRMLKHMYSIGYGGKQALARAAGIKQQNITEIQHGRRPLSPKVLAALGLRAVTMYEVIGDPVTLTKPVFNRRRKDFLASVHVTRPASASVLHRMEG
jgi:hypothetical protein